MGWFKKLTLSEDFRSETSLSGSLSETPSGVVFRYTFSARCFGTHRHSIHCQILFSHPSPSCTEEYFDTVNTNSPFWLIFLFHFGKGFTSNIYILRVGLWNFKGIMVCYFAHLGVFVLGSNFMKPWGCFNWWQICQTTPETFCFWQLVSQNLQGCFILVIV